MEARFHDGRTAQPQTVSLTASEGVLTFTSRDGDHRWPLRDVAAESLGDLVRLSCETEPSARLMADAVAWRRLRGPGVSVADSRRRRGERRLIAGLAAVGGLVLLFVFVILPAASRPLARATPPEFERRLGESFEAQLTTAFRPCRGLDGQAALYHFGDRFEPLIGGAFNVRVRAVEAPFANAFALPGGAILVTDDLIREARTPDELSAVIAHEVGYVEQRHVMQAVWRSFGLGLTLDAIVGGGTGAGQQAVLLAGSATNLRYSRKAEAEADARGMALLRALGLSSKGMAPFFERMAAKADKGALASAEEFVSSHPDSRRRAAASRSLERAGQPAFDPAEWSLVKGACDDHPELDVRRSASR